MKRGLDLRICIVPARVNLRYGGVPIGVKWCHKFVQFVGVGNKRYGYSGHKYYFCSFLIRPVELFRSPPHTTVVIITGPVCLACIRCAFLNTHSAMCSQRKTTRVLYWFMATAVPVLFRFKLTAQRRRGRKRRVSSFLHTLLQCECIVNKNKFEHFLNTLYADNAAPISGKLNFYCYS